MLTETQIQENKEKFISIIDKQMDKLGCEQMFIITHNNIFENYPISLIQTGEMNTTAPASTQYHCSYKGGLCEHSLNVYNQLCKIVSNMPEDPKNKYSQDTLKIVSLLHDFSKMNFYELAERNTKDENGNWIKVPYIKVKDSKDRFLYANHEFNSLYMVSSFIPLNIEEEVAISHHHMGMSEDSIKDNISGIVNRYPLALYLHLADMLSCYVIERV